VLDGVLAVDRDVAWGIFAPAITTDEDSFEVTVVGGGEELGVDWAGDAAFA
jgi:hypothetical protein